MDNHDLEFRKIPSLNFLCEVNENGTIFRNVKTGYELKIKLDMHHSPSGYFVTFVHLNGRHEDSCIKRVMIHTVVAECWLGPKPEGYQVDHIDRNSQNNDYRNLRYVTHSEQMKNRDHSNISKRGAKNLEEARNLWKVAITLRSETCLLHFDSISACARWLEEHIAERDFEKYRYLLRRRYQEVAGFQVSYHSPKSVKPD